MQSKPVLIFIGIVILVFIWNLFGFLNKMQDTARNKKIAEDKVAELEKAKAKLTSDIDKLNTNAGVEESIREKFGLAKEGEGLIVIVDEKAPPAVEANAGGSGFFGWFKNLFK